MNPTAQAVRMGGWASGQAALVPVHIPTHHPLMIAIDDNHDILPLTISSWDRALTTRFFQARCVWRIYGAEEMDGTGLYIPQLIMSTLPVFFVLRLRWRPRGDLFIDDGRLDMDGEQCQSVEMGG